MSEEEKKMLEMAKYISNYCKGKDYKPAIVNIGRGQVIRGNLATLAGIDENDIIESEYYKCLAELWNRTVERMDSIAKENDVE